jgi:exo-1,4-beta-D-glucosaminidase
MISVPRFFLLLICGVLLSASANAQMGGSRGMLRDGWKLQSGCVARAAGEQVSSVGFDVSAWIETSVPHTVLGAQVDAGIFRDPFLGMNLRGIPGPDYPFGKIFGYLPMSDSSSYHCSWWYRREFDSPALPGQLTWLSFKGINYGANIWLNGKQLANANDVAGAFRSYEFDVMPYLVRRGGNILAVEVFAQTEKDLGIDFLDWDPSLADKSLGLWREVYLATSGRVTLRNPSVSTRFAGDDLSQAELTIVADITNHSGRSWRCSRHDRHNPG